MIPARWMLKIVKALAWCFAIAALFLIFFYTPFYSKLIVYGLNHWVPVQVNAKAAKSQQAARLTEYDDLEPGSDVWIARQAYLKLMEQALKDSSNTDLLQRMENLQEKGQEKGQDLYVPYSSAAASSSNNQIANTVTDEALQTDSTLTKVFEIQARYEILQQLILQERKIKQVRLAAEWLKNNTFDVEASSNNALPLFATDTNNNTATPQQQQRTVAEDMDFARYQHFLLHYPVRLDPKKQSQSRQQIVSDLLLLKQLQAQPSSKRSKPYAIVVLGGGLTLDAKTQNVVINAYTRTRLETTIRLLRIYNLPIVLSGVEAPYMQAWLKKDHVEAKLLEDRSMNTCENSRFSSLLLQKKGGAPTVLLVTDLYHMPRTRRLFAQNGIETIAVIAPMPTQPTAWRPSMQNYDHSRRANYELLATMRDMLFGSSDCREIP